MGYIHFEVKINTQHNTSAANHCDYIMREGRYQRQDIAQEFVTGESFNIPEWAKNPKEFFEAADQYERKNGIVYREIVGSLPNQISLQEQIKIVHSVIEKCIGKDKACAYAIHSKKSKINKIFNEQSTNTHFHLMWSERCITDISSQQIKPKEIFFKRYTPQNPQSSGYKKDDTYRGNQTKRKKIIKKQREIFADIINAKFKELGINDSVTPLSIKDQKKQAQEKNDTENLERLRERKSAWLPLMAYKKLEKILLAQTEMKEKISQIINLDINDMVKGKQKITREGKFTTRLKQKIITLANITKIAKKKENIAEEFIESRRTRYLTEIIANIAQRLLEAQNYKTKKINKIQSSEYYKNNKLKDVSISIVTKGLYKKYMKIVKQIQKTEPDSIKQAQLISQAQNTQKQINVIMTPQNEEKTRTIFQKFKAKKEQLTTFLNNSKIELKIINTSIIAVSELAGKLQNENNITNVNSLMSQENLKAIEKIVVQNKEKGDKGFNSNNLIPFLKETDKFISETNNALQERIKNRHEEKTEQNQHKQNTNNKYNGR